MTGAARVQGDRAGRFRSDVCLEASDSVIVVGLEMVDNMVTVTMVN